MLFFTGFSRFASEIAKTQVESTPHKQRELSAMHQMVDQAISILSGDGDLTEFGSLLHESWMLKRSLTAKVSTPEVDQIYEAAMNAGAYGGKLLGAGGGGFMLLFARPQDQPRIKKLLSALLHVPFRFETHGSQIIFYEPGALERDFHSLKTLSNGQYSEEEVMVWSRPISTS